MRCRWCGEPLRFERGRGWVHGDGKVYKTRVDADGIERDDHVAFPVPDKKEEVSRAILPSERRTW
jgi:hypothetical protein